MLGQLVKNLMLLQIQLDDRLSWQLLQLNPNEDDHGDDDIA